VTARVSFYGDASSHRYHHRGHFTYGPEVRGIPAWESVTIPRELWGNSPDTRYSKWHAHEYDHAHLLPYVPVRPEHRICRMRSLGNTDHHEHCVCSDGRTEGQAPGTALITYTPNYTVLACWDYTGDMRGGCYSMFWIKGRLTANAMVEAIKRDFPVIWARITMGGVMALQGGDDEPSPVAAEKALPKVTTAQETFNNAIPNEFFAQCVGTTVEIMEESVPVANERLRSVGVKR